MSCADLILTRPTNASGGHDRAALLLWGGAIYHYCSNPAPASSTSPRSQAIARDGVRYMACRLATVTPVAMDGSPYEVDDVDRGHPIVNLEVLRRFRLAVSHGSKADHVHID
jgi:hypothetical protein